MGKHHKIYLATGSNLGNRQAYLKEATQRLSKEVGRVLNRSQIYETEAWGQQEQPAFLNQVLELETTLTPQELIDKCLQIEAELGRQRQEQVRWEARSIDIDILFYGNEIINEEKLRIPHSRLHLRNFVLIPLMEIAGEFIHPILQQSITALYQKSNDPLEVILVD